MSLIIDKQTLDDLNIFGKRDNDSVYAIFNRTFTRGGAEILEQLFRYPLSDVQSINNRSLIIKYFKDNKIAFPFRGDLFDATEHYLSNTDERSRLSHGENTLGRKFNHLMGADTEYQQLVKGMASIVEILVSLQGFVKQYGATASATPYARDVEEIKRQLDTPDFAPLLQEKVPVKLDYNKAVEYDRLLRYTHRERIKKLLTVIYYLDVYISVATVAEQRGFVFPEAVDSESHTMIVEGVYHPKLKKAVANDLTIEPGNNIVFLTGANMAGKSTFMKSLGIAVFLAHVGFPVAASRMQFSVCDGLLTTINLPDDLNNGYSHFYTEVLRVKKMAVQLESSRNLFIIFDELFRGTNVKDAYEATVAITAAFAGRDNCMFVVSTHIIEAGDELKETCNNINYVYLPTLMDGDKPVYPHKLEKGITSDRHGMVIINNEGILDILHKGKKATI
ncbi:MAG: DNA mismatch repair protein [Candidatus Pseudobacter hemicellulosilyticus]|uniref:DNA mismatch repair protein n=1 Tax=Candidatus Pseudobacter hemicellulosilyticus TaxID=3121375 RepID=A0AAJ6BG90_9BACT|nr:MAG: DNA mismatch repair protein [Pseudobacter sp.]